MTKQDRINCLEVQLATASKDIKFQCSVIEAQRKRAEAVALAWRNVHPDDKSFMLAAKHEDPDLFDVYNRLLYSYGRPDERGVVVTRLSS